MFQILKKRKQLGWVAFLCFFTLPPLQAFSFPILHKLPQRDLAPPTVETGTPYVEKRSLEEIWDTAREREEGFTFSRVIPASTANAHPQSILLVVFPKITSARLSVGTEGKERAIFAREGHRYPPLASYENDQLTLFQLLQAGHRACEITMTIQHGEILTAKESTGCVDYESKGHLLSKALIGAKILPPSPIIESINAKILPPKKKNDAA